MNKVLARIIMALPVVGMVVIFAFASSHFGLPGVLVAGAGVIVGILFPLALLWAAATLWGQDDE